MKEKIIIFVLGTLVGALITTGSFFAYTKANNCNNQNIEMHNRINLEMPNKLPNEYGEIGKHSKIIDNNNQENQSSAKVNDSTDI